MQNRSHSDTESDALSPPILSSSHGSGAEIGTWPPNLATVQTGYNRIQILEELVISVQQLEDSYEGSSAFQFS